MPDAPARPFFTRLLASLRRVHWRSHLLTLALLVSVVYGMNAWRTRDVPALAPPLAGELAGGGHTTLDAFRAANSGQPVALHVWADWCPVCRTEEHSISALVRDGLPVLTIAMQSGDADSVGRVLAERGLSWPTLIDEDGAISRAFGLPGVPAFVVIDAQGRVSDVQVGYTSEMGMRLRLWLAAQ
jgi:thiol-disulfide isomerase/thioredoxin